MRRPRRLPSLTALRAFEAAATHLSFLRAARELSVTPTAISHQVRGLEGTLGQPLFRRLPRQLELTPAGARLLQDLAKSFDAIEASVAALRPQPGPATVTLTTNTAFAARWVLPRLGTLARDCPGVRLRLQASETVADLQRGEADLAIRHGHGDWPGLVAQALMVEHYAPVCSPALGVDGPQDLQRHPLIHLDWQAHACAPALWERWFERAGIAAAHPGAATPALSFSDETQAMAAALGGHGVALLSLTLVADELRSGALVQPFGPALETGSYYIATARGREREPAIAAVWEWVAAQAAGTASLQGPSAALSGPATRSSAHRARRRSSDRGTA